MKKIGEIRQGKNKACELVRTEDDTLCYYFHFRDRKGRAKNIIINVSDVIYPAWIQMTEKEKNIIGKELRL